MSHVVIAVISAIAGLVALAVAVASDELVSLPGLLAGILLLNAAIRFMLART
jgi:hypothetical protein